MTLATNRESNSNPTPFFWDSVAAVPEAVEISPALRAELEARLLEFESNPEAGYSWDQVKARFKDGTWRSA